MIRWSYVLPRLVAVVAILLFVTYGLSPLAHRITVATLQSLTGARVDLEHVEVGLFPPRLIYHQLALANPSGDKSMSNIASAEKVELQIDGRELLRRRYVIRDARITGLQFDSDRLTAGHLAADPDSAEADEPSVIGNWISTWFDSIGDAAEDKLTQWIDESEISRRADQIRRRWKTEYELLAKRANDLETAIRDIQETAKGIDNPLRDFPRVEATLNQAKGIQEELVSVRVKLESLPEQVRLDLQSMEKAKEKDRVRVRELVPFDMAEGVELGSGLIRETVRIQLARARGYLDTGREVSKWTVTKPKIERSRGEVIDLDSGPELPTVLISRCEIAGQLRSGGKPYQLTGILENLTPQPKLREQPLRARLRLDGEQVVKVNYTRDDSTAAATESLSLHWPTADAPTIRLGSNDTIDLDIRDGRIEWWVELQTQGEQLSGRLVSRRVDTRIELDAPERISRSVMFTSLKGSLASIDQVQVEATLAGTWKDPEFTIQTNLTELLRTGVREAAQQQLVDTRERLESELDEAYAKQLRELQDWLAGQQTKANELIAKANRTVQDAQGKIVAETQKADAYLGRLRDKVPAETQKAEAYLGRLRGKVPMF